uniref:Uncharacterized protein n=1 Tax=Fundulus heteroclitus TaxID=8078 RepID=A0A3Q2NWI7_FUNHE
MTILNSSNIDFLPCCLPGQEVCLCALEAAEMCGERGRRHVCGCASLCVHIHQNKEFGGVCFCCSPADL